MIVTVSVTVPPLPVAVIVYVIVLLIIYCSILEVEIGMVPDESTSPIPLLILTLSAFLDVHLSKNVESGSVYVTLEVKDTVGATVGLIAVADAVDISSIS